MLSLMVKRQIAATYSSAGDGVTQEIGNEKRASRRSKWSLRYIEVMATAPQFLTVEEFDKLYGSESGWEYWYGKAVRKPVPDKLHALLQRILMQLLSAAGYESGGEFDFKARRDWQPRPDVAILPEGDERFPTTLSLVIEILSDDQTKELTEKCRNYEETGVSHIFVFDPTARVIYRWQRGLVETQDLELPNGSLISGTAIWRELQAAKTRLKMTL
jgi:Uma2 family endonuclease